MEWYGRSLVTSLSVRVRTKGPSLGNLAQGRVQSRECPSPLSLADSLALFHCAGHPTVGQRLRKVS